MWPVFNLTFLAIFVFGFIFIRHVRKRSCDPPGPLGLPFVGMSLHILVQQCFKRFLPKLSILTSFQQLRDKYGEVWSIDLGGRKIVEISSYEAYQEAFIENGLLFSHRPKDDIFDHLSGNKGFLLNNSSNSKINRKSAIQALKEFNMGLESGLYESNLMIDHLKRQPEASVGLQDYFFEPIANIFCKLFFNQRYTYNDPIFKHLKTNLKVIVNDGCINGQCAIFNHFGVTKLGRLLLPDVDRFLTSWSTLTSFVHKLCNKLIENRNPVPSCIFEYLMENNNTITGMIKGDTTQEIAQTIRDMLIASVEPLNGYVNFCVLFMGRYKTVQSDLRQEIRNLTDDYSNIHLDMRKNCPKLTSFADEVSRYCCLFVNTPRSVIKPCVFRGYKLNPNDIILGNWGAICKDRTLFKEPYTFDPYRFMDESRTKYIPSKFMIPLGLGKRACIAENVNNMVIFIILAKLLVTFEISLTKETENNFDNIIEGVNGFIHSSLEHKVKFSLLPKLNE